LKREQIKDTTVKLMAVWYNRLLVTFLAFLPLWFILYIASEISPDKIFVAHTFHVIVISLAVLFSGFLSYITWRCYRATGEELLRWLVYGFLGFTIIYAPHGLLTHYDMDNIWVFVLFGPASRLIMAFCFLVAMLKYGEVIEPEKARKKS